MRELGAFEVEAPEPLSAASSGADPGTPAAPLPPPGAGLAATASASSASAGPTPSQLRHALAKADPGTRRRLLRLIGERGPNPAKAAPPTGQERLLLRLDEQTELLAAATHPSQRREEIVGQLAQARGARPEVAADAAPRILFPTYDPRQHGPDLRNPRRPDVPVEGHFPPPRQPSTVPAPSVRERTTVSPSAAGQEAVVPAQASTAGATPPAAPPAPSAPAHPTLSAPLLLRPTARDGVNGLLLSLRDLDAVVEEGVLDAPTAERLWKTWSARRPVIHVVDDPVPLPQTAADPPGQSASTTDGRVAPDGTAAGQESAGLDTPTDPALPMPPSRPDGASSLPIAQQVPAAADPKRVAAGPDRGPAHSGDRFASRQQRAAWLVRQVWRSIVAACVLSTAARLGLWAWPHARPWLDG